MNESSQPDNQRIPLLWVIPESLVARYAMNFVAQRTEHEVILSFFETTPPILIGTPEDRRERIEMLGHIEAKCVARVILTHARAAQLLEVLKMNVEGKAGTLEDPRSTGEEP